MKVFRFGGQNLDDILRQVGMILSNGDLKNIRLVADDPNSITTDDPRNDDPADKVEVHHSGPVDASKIFWIDEIKEKSDSKKTIVFHVVAPLAIKETIKVRLRNVDGTDIIYLDFDNNGEIFEHCTTCNFRTEKSVHYKYSFENYKVIKKGIKLNFDNGVITLTVPSESTKKKDDDFVLGL